MKYKPTSSRLLLGVKQNLKKIQILYELRSVTTFDVVVRYIIAQFAHRNLSTIHEFGASSYGSRFALAFITLLYLQSGRLISRVCVLSIVHNFLDDVSRTATYILRITNASSFGYLLGISALI